MQVTLISLEYRELLRSFNDQGSCMNKMDNSNNNDKVPASCNHYFLKPLCSQTLTSLIISTTEGEPNCANPPMSVNNIYNSEARLWPKNTILIAGDSMINDINQKRFCVNFETLKI